MCFFCARFEHPSTPPWLQLQILLQLFLVHVSAFRLYNISRPSEHHYFLITCVPPTLTMASNMFLQVHIWKLWTILVLVDATLREWRLFPFFPKKWCFLSSVTMNFDSQRNHPAKHEWYILLLNITKETHSLISSIRRYSVICETYQSVRSKNKHTEFVLTTFAVVHSCFTFMNLLSPLSPPFFLLSLPSFSSSPLFPNHFLSF